MVPGSKFRNQELSMLASSDRWNNEVKSFANQKMVERLMEDFMADKGGRMKTGELVNFQRLASEYASFDGCCQSPDRCEECRDSYSC